MKYPNTKSWLCFWCCCFNFLNTLIFRCLFWRLILVCSLLVRVLSSITLHSRCLSSFNWFDWFSLYLNARLSFLMSLTIFRMMTDYFFHWFFNFGFVRAVSVAKRIWFSLKISILTWCLCVSRFGYEAVTFFLDAFSEFKLRWHHGCWKVVKSSSLACIYVHLFSGFVLPRIWFLWCFCCCMSLRKSCGCWFSFRCPRDVSSFGYETLVTIFNWKLLQGMYGSVPCTFDVFRRNCKVSTI